MKSTEELFKDAYDNCEAQDIRTINIEAFIENCESTYKMTTEEFLKWFEENNYEGNVEQQLWYKHSKGNEGTK